LLSLCPCFTPLEEKKEMKVLSVATFCAVLGFAEAGKSLYDVIFVTIGGKSHEQIAQAFAVVLMLAGLAATFFGQKAVSQMRFVFGFTAMFLLGFWAMSHTIHSDLTILCASGAIGLAFGVLSSLISKAAYAAIAFAGAYMISYASHVTFLSYFKHQTTTFYVAIGVAGLVVLFLLSRAWKLVNLLIVAFAGAFAFITGIGLLTRQGFTSGHIDAADLHALDWSLIGGWAALGALGSVYQLCPSILSRLLKICQCRKNDKAATRLAVVQPRSYVPEASYFVAPNDMSRVPVGHHVGLINMGNTCFANASLQALCSVPAVRQAYINAAVQKQGGEVAQLLGSVLYLLQTSRSSSVKPRELREILKSMAFDDGCQHDASEFMRSLINKIIDENTEVEQAIKRTFGFQIRGLVRCSNCNAESQVSEDSIDLCLQLPTRTDGGVHTINALMEHAFRDTHFEGENLFHCDKCSSLQPAVRSTYVASLPSSLVLTLNRFKFCHDTQHESKLMDAVSVPERINLNRYHYRLAAVVAHAGASMNHGHYYAFARVQRDLGVNEWVKFDDDRVTVIPFHEVERVCSSSSPSGSAYIVIYSKQSEDV